MQELGAQRGNLVLLRVLFILWRKTEWAAEIWQLRVPCCRRWRRLCWHVNVLGDVASGRKARWIQQKSAPEVLSWTSVPPCFDTDYSEISKAHTMLNRVTAAWPNPAEMPENIQFPTQTRAGFSYILTATEPQALYMGTSALCCEFFRQGGRQGQGIQASIVPQAALSV